MPPIEVGPSRAISAADARLARPTGGESVAPAQTAGAKAPSAPTPAIQTSSVQTSSVQTSAALDPGEAPVDTDRVAVIRKAVEEGSYPVIPTRIADAMIAAGVLLRSPK